MKYKTNLKVTGNKVFSYGIHVATIEGNDLIQLRPLLVDCGNAQEHINHVAEELDLILIN